MLNLSPTYPQVLYNTAVLGCFETEISRPSFISSHASLVAAHGSRARLLESYLEVTFPLAIRDWKTHRRKGVVIMKTHPKRTVWEEANGVLGAHLFQNHHVNSYHVNPVNVFQRSPTCGRQPDLQTFLQVNKPQGCT